jgi:hypothetical protein
MPANCGQFPQRPRNVGSSHRTAWWAWCGRVASPLLGRGAGGRSPGFLMPPRLAARVQMLLAQPPEELSAEEAEVWRLTVEGMRPDWFGPEVRPLLRAYCTQTALAQLLAQELRVLAVGGKNDAVDCRGCNGQTSQ